ncbi:MAG: sulfurtransferase TusA family protein [Candidatus Thermoplasmatota archaeon]|jgi:TusA-related sulfurtransferase|nr:sulfurtransferase TusA family protein [Candidatus Thermoplasmatota archaeon]MCL5962939.1 sulfurtransferase TusA family protein [Candidatus Thermoplasmatota archaeon]
MSDEKVTKVIDARGSYCPGPLMKLIENVRLAKVGDVLDLLSSDSGTKKDAPNWIKKTGQELIGIYDEEGYTRIRIKKIK